MVNGQITLSFSWGNFELMLFVGCFYVGISLEGDGLREYVLGWKHE